MEIAKWIIAFVAVYNFGGFLFDAVLPRTSRMHMRNPNWQPHAKFHNAQSMTMGIMLGMLSLIMLFAFPPLTLAHLLVAAACAGIYFLAMLMAQFFPGTTWLDPEFDGQVGKPLGLNEQLLVTYILCALLLVAVILAVAAG